MMISRLSALNTEEDFIKSLSVLTSATITRDGDTILIGFGGTLKETQEALLMALNIMDLHYDYEYIP
jgi:hypothetical protein